MIYILFFVIFLKSMATPFHELLQTIDHLEKLATQNALQDNPLLTEIAKLKQKASDMQTQMTTNPLLFLNQTRKEQQVLSEQAAAAKATAEAQVVANEKKTMKNVVHEIEQQRQNEITAGIIQTDSRPAWLQAWSRGYRGGPPTEISANFINSKTGKAEPRTIRMEYGEVTYDSWDDSSKIASK